MSNPRKLFPLVSADVALFSIERERLRVLLVQRANTPEQGRWALPGGVLKPDLDDSLEDTARRILREKTGLEVPYLGQVATYSGPDRDPRGWSVSVLFCALLPLDQVPAIAGSKTEAVAWRDAARPGQGLAFDHARHVATALAKLRAKVERHALPLHLLPPKFTLTQLQRTVEAILDREVEKSAFRRRLKADPTLEEVPGEFERGVQRPAQLYRAAAGFAFEAGAA
jgi:ADP-ribose pyrophosphatase YjhB (NUDIX family)